MPLACWSMKTLTVCRTACRTLWSVYWAGGDTGRLRMSASDLFSPQLLSVTASCLKQTIFVSQCNYHHLVILTMLTSSPFLQSLQMLMLSLCDCCCSSAAPHVVCRVSNLIKWRWWRGKTLFSINFILNLTVGVLALSLPPALFHTDCLVTDTLSHDHMQVNYSIWASSKCACMFDYQVRAVG